MLGVVIPVVVGLVCQMYMFLNAWDTVRHLTLNWTMIAWRGLLDDPSYATPLERGLLAPSSTPSSSWPWATSCSAAAT